MKKILLLLLIVCSLTVGSGTLAVQAASGPVLTSSSAEVDFPAGITFKISSASDVNVIDIRLHYIVNRISDTLVVSEIVLPFAPALKVSSQWFWDMRMTGGLPPGSSVDYWWTVTDISGNTLEPVPATIQIRDNRYEWHSLTRGQVTLYWYKGDEAFAVELMDAADVALSRLDASTGATIESPVAFYIYANSSDLKGSMIFPQEWTGGVAFTEWGIIAIGIGTSSGELEWGKSVIAHELTHLVIHQVTSNPYSGLPTWLDEGLAMLSEGALDGQFITALTSARNNNAFISVRSLASPFSAYADESVLSYAQSYEIVKYLVDTYGQPKMFELLDTFTQGSGYDEALQKVYGFDMDGLNTQWLASYAGVGVD